MFEVVRGTGQRPRLVAGADADPDAERDRANARNRLGDDPQPSGEDSASYDASVRPGEQGAGAAGALVATGKRDRHAYSPAGDSVVVAGAASPSPSPSRTGTSESLPRGSISAICTWTLLPTGSTSSTFSTLLPPTILRICEMCSNPSLPGVSETKAPNVVVFTTVPR